LLDYILPHDENEDLCQHEDIGAASWSLGIILKAVLGIQTTYSIVSFCRF